MSKSPGTGTRGLRFLGGLLLGTLVVGGGLVAVSVLAPVGPRDELAARDDDLELEPEASPGQDNEPVAVLRPEVAPSDPSRPAPVPQPSADVNRSVRGAIEPSPPAEDGRFSAPEPFETSVTDGSFSGLPPTARLEGPGEVAEVPEVESQAFELQGPALQINAVPFEPRGLPLVAVVLQDAGESPLSVETLLSLSMPLTLGIAPRDEGDVKLAAEAKLANYEVLAQIPIGLQGTGLSPTMTDVQLEERLEEMMASLWMSVGASALVEAGPGLDERLMLGFITAMQRNGFAFVNTDAATQEAGRAVAGAFGVAYASEVRQIGADASEDEVKAALTAAAEAAAADGGAIVSGPPSLAMLRALSQWAVENSGRSVQLAPLSAVITARQGS